MRSLAGRCVVIVRAPPWQVCSNCSCTPLVHEVSCWRVCSNCCSCTPLVHVVSCWQVCSNCSCTPLVLEVSCWQVCSNCSCTPLVLEVSRWQVCRAMVVTFSPNDDNFSDVSYLCNCNGWDCLSDFHRVAYVFFEWLPHKTNCFSITYIFLIVFCFILIVGMHAGILHLHSIERDVLNLSFHFGKFSFSVVRHNTIFSCMFTLFSLCNIYTI